MFEVLDQAQGTLNLSESLREDVDVDLVRHPESSPPHAKEASPVPQGNNDPSGRNLNPNGVNKNVAQTQIRCNSHVINSPLRYEVEYRETFMANLLDADEPKDLKENISCPAKENWIMVMEEELEYMRVNHVWDLVDILMGR